MEKTLINIDQTIELSKSDLIAKGKEDAQFILDEGFTDALELVSKARKAVEYLTAFSKQCDSEARGSLTYSEVRKVYGSEFSLGSTGDRLDYEKDHEYSRRKKRLKDREDLLKLAHKSDDQVIDEDGGIVEDVGIKSPSREILKVKM